MQLLLASAARHGGGRSVDLWAQPDSGLLGHHQFGFTVVQYWRSFDQLEAYARRSDQLH
ncbi:MAG: monooxygenase family protein [Cyanobacteriota bacterium]